MADTKKEETTPVEKTETKPEETKPTEEKPAETPAKPAEDTKAAVAKATAASSSEEVPDVVTSETYKTNEEDETSLWDGRARLYRWHVESKEWRERGTGTAKLLKHKENGRVRFLMRRDKTLKICGNHYVLPTMTLQPNKNNDKSWIWDCPADYSEDPAKPSQDIYAIRFNTADDTKGFKDAWFAAQAHMKELLTK